MSSPSSLDLSKLKVSQLKQRLRDAGLPIGGKKSELIDRLTESMTEEQKTVDEEEDNNDGSGPSAYRFVSPDSSDQEEDDVNEDENGSRMHASEEKALESTSSSVTPPKNRIFGATKRKLTAMLSEEDSSGLDQDSTTTSTTHKRHKKSSNSDSTNYSNSNQFDNDEKSEEHTDCTSSTSSSSTMKKEPAIKGDGPSLKIVCYNVNGVRAATKHGLEDYLTREDGDFVCLSEMKAEESQSPLDLNQNDTLKQYKHVYWNASRGKKGYAGTCILSKRPAITIEKAVGFKFSDTEGRVICLEFDTFFLINTYVPNSGDKLKFKNNREGWDKKMYQFLQSKQKNKPVIWTGDLNVAIRDFDVYDGETNANRQKTAGFTPYERSNIRSILDDLNMVDSYAHLYPDRRGKELFTFYSKRGKNLKSDGKGWRLDYFIVSQSIVPLISDVSIRRDEECSDHVPLVMNFTQP